MNILVVEDDENKREQIGRFVSDKYPQACVSYANSQQSGLRAIIKDPIDLIILDMSMPTFDKTVEEDGGRPQAYAGREILKQMDRREIHTPVIVLTGYDKFGEGVDALTLPELKSQLVQAHPDCYRGMVFYDVAVEGWKDELMTMISEVFIKA
jgi:DNA-binding NarL/FixJ family response regulator